MTVPDMPVGAGTEQSPKTNKLSIAQDDDYCNPLAEVKIYLAEKDKREAGFIPTKPCLSVTNLNDLYSYSFKGTPPIIENFLYPGVQILAGAPKVGKSFLVGQIAYHVSMGIPFWGMKVTQGNVLYLALEDDLSRLQKRMSTMFGVEGTDKLDFAINAGTITDGLETQLEHYLGGRPNTNLIIIDTLQKVRENTHEGYSYAGDYEVISRLKQFADANRICILPVHHTRKQKATDIYEMISGTTGILGCADGAMVLTKENRTDNNAELSIVGRDMPDQKLLLVRNTDTLCWEMTEREVETFETRIDPELMKIVNLITDESPEWIGTPSDLIEESGAVMPVNMITKTLNVNSSELKNRFNINYISGRTSVSRWIRLYRDTPQNDSNDSNDGLNGTPKQLSQPSQPS